MGTGVLSEVCTCTSVKQLTLVTDTYPTQPNCTVIPVGL